MLRSTTFAARGRQPSAVARAPRDAAESTPLFTRHMLGVIELERDERRRRHAAIRDGTHGYEPAAGVVEKVAAVFAAAAPAPALASPEVDRWVGEGGSFD